MEKKQLDLDAPLLSVRRFSSPLRLSNGVNKKKVEKSLPHKQNSLPSSKSDWELGEVAKPAAVPFVWEQIPGRPKDGGESEAPSPVEPSNTPRLPPGRSGEIPRLPLGRSGELPRLPPGRSGELPKLLSEEPRWNDMATLIESLNKELDKEGNCASEIENDEYSDALDKLSLTESVSMNCSISGLSGFGISDAKLSGIFSTDVQTRDFMMNRFLPAAKAMVLDAPQHVSKKKRTPVAPEQPKLVSKVVSAHRSPLLDQHRPGIVPGYRQYAGDIESEDENHEYYDYGKISMKTRGFFSRFCLKNSLCLLNPVPGIKARSQPRKPPVKEVNRLNRTAYSGPLTQNANKHVESAAYKRSTNSGARSQELYKVNTKLTSEPPRLSYSGDLRMIRGPSPNRGFSRGGISPYRNEAPQSPFYGKKMVRATNGFEVAKAIKGCNNIQDTSGHQRYKQVSGSTTPVEEKTLYIDYVNTKAVPTSKSISSRAKTENLNDIAGKDFASSDDIKVEGAATRKAYVHEVRSSDILDKGNKPVASGSFRADKLRSARTSNPRRHSDRMDNSTREQGPQDQQLSSLDMGSSRLHSNEKQDTRNELVLKVVDQASPKVGSPRPPPLPKSPSESWLWRTIPLRRPSSQSQFDPSKQPHDSNAKWETIVKTSHVHHDYVRYSEELIPHVSQHSKT
ncbi:uncharacterized protein LOC127808877 [Diospyros lotus]|uniref:uncharacterized protein LOC127808877 n=1 Tax=Diospyros lotus TaxID=55363 RepID=UPI00224F3C66|nr:uncharacterized protein LOC127808877 [Diospyros lotus]XP_052203527.1 uncharacterized protein LOC127808877 [Diospyros lotus]